MVKPKNTQTDLETRVLILKLNTPIKPSAPEANQPKTHMPRRTTAESTRLYDPTMPTWPQSDSGDESAEDEKEKIPTTIEGWMHRAPTFLFADNKRTMLVWDTEEGGGVITKYSIGKLPARHAEAVITMLMKTVENLGGAQPEGCNKRQRRV